jgi:hypothetical protein
MVGATGFEPAMFCSQSRDTPYNDFTGITTIILYLLAMIEVGDKI